MTICTRFILKVFIVIRFYLALWILLPLGWFIVYDSEAQTLNKGIIDPTATYAGMTYAEMATGFWQYYTSLPATNNPFNRNPLYPVAPLSTGQKGPIWYLCGNFSPGGTDIYTDSIPGGVGLLAMITEVEYDNNFSCSPTSYTEAELRSLAKSYEDGATGMSLIIDGVAITGLTDVLTCPYRVQSTVADFTCPAVHNVLHDVFGAPSCFENNTGTPYTIPGAVEDGVFLMIAPLSAGSHKIQSTWRFPALSISGNWTRNLIVGPVNLAANASGNPEALILSWPQTPDTYAIESSSNLSSPDWQPRDLPVFSSNGVYSAMAPIETGNRFYRLRVK